LNGLAAMTRHHAVIIRSLHHRNGDHVSGARASTMRRSIR